MDSRDSHIETISADLRTVYAGLHQLSVPAWLRLDLKMAQFKALIAIERSSGIAVCALGRELGIGESAASQLVDQLVRRGYVGRKSDRTDRRRVRLAATSRGTRLLEELRQGSEQSLKEWLASLDDEGLEVLARGLGGLTQLMSADTVRAARDATTDKLRT
jgi:DNA-binding MarR family transcriptional regulator